MTRLSRDMVAYAMAFAFVGAFGCSSDERGIVNGNVTLDATPLKEGVIRFVPVDGKSPTADGPIVAGRFSVAVLPGEKKVEISAPKVVGKRKMYDTPDSKEVDEVAELIPAHYNIRSELKMTVERGPQEKQFDLKSK